MRAVLIGGILVLAGSASLPNSEEIPAKGEFEQDLVLHVKWLPPKTIQAGQSIGLTIALKNTSATKTYPVVKPGDGSEVGWREPYVFYTARRETLPGRWEDVAKQTFGRCGLFDWNWEKDITKLAPGQTLELKDWLVGPAETLEMQKPGRYQLFVHYRFQGGNAGKGITPAKAQKANDIPDFEIVSAPIEFEVIRPLDVVAKIKAALNVKTKTKLSDLLDIQLVNLSDEALEVTPPTLIGEARLTLEIEGKFGGWRPVLDQQQAKETPKHTLKPKESLSILGENKLTNGLDGTWEYPVEDVVRLRAVYSTSTASQDAVIKSDWIQMNVE